MEKELYPPGANVPKYPLYVCQQDKMHLCLHLNVIYAYLMLTSYS